MIPETATLNTCPLLSEKLCWARSRLYQHRFLQPNTHFAAFLNFRDLQDLHSFASFFSEMGNITPNAELSYIFCQAFCNFLLQILGILQILNQIRRFYAD